TQHRDDHKSLARILSTDVGYVALIASRRRAGLVMNYLRGLGVGEDALSRVRAPCGLHLGAKTAAEIALFVIREIVLVRRSQSRHSNACGALSDSSEEADGNRLVKRPWSTPTIQMLEGRD